MLQARSLVLAAMLATLPSTAITAQTTTTTGTPSTCSDSRVLNAPYSAKRHFTSVENRADGTINRSESGGSEARDSQGRTYSAGERQWTYLDGDKRVLKSEILYRIEDPVANTETRWDSSSKEAKVIHWRQSSSNQAAAHSLFQTACGYAMSSSPEHQDAVEKLGVKTLGGVVVEGTRSTYTVPVGQDHNNQPIVVVHDIWYCPELKIVVLETNDDPRSGKTRSELVGIVRGEPDVTQYLPPSNYVIHEVQIPQAQVPQ